MNDEQIVKYCQRLIMNNLAYNNCDKEIPAVIASEAVLLDHCYGIKELMTKCIEILENKGVSLDD